MDRLFFVLGAASGVLSVALGAFAAHALKGRIAADAFARFELGVRYQMYHALALLAVGGAFMRSPGPALAASGWLFVAGTVLFSGTLYALALGAPRWLGGATPVGGLALIAGWLALAWSAAHG